jgi:hypothetical protein
MAKKKNTPTLLLGCILETAIHIISLVNKWIKRKLTYNLYAKDFDFDHCMLVDREVVEKSD